MPGPEVCVFEAIFHVIK